MRNAKIKNLFVKNSRLIILFLLVIFFSTTTKTFWSIGKWDNVLNIILQQAPFSILLAIVMTFAIMLGGIDLSMGSAVALQVSIIGMVLHATYNPWLGILTGLGLGALIGVINGLLIAKVKILPFVATYSLQWILRGIAFVLLGGMQIFDLGPTFRPMFVSSRYTFFIIVAIISIVLMFLLHKTTFGKQVYAVGHNIEAAKLSGIKTEKVVFLIWLMNGIIVSIASILFIANLGTAEPNIGENFPINAVAASLIGGTTVGGGSGSVGKAIVGSFIFLVLTNGMVQIGAPVFWQQFVVGAVIIVSVVLERGMEKLYVDMD